MADKSTFSKFDHVGVIVKDLDKAVEYLQSLGMGPFKPIPNRVRYDTKFYGKPVDPGNIKLGIMEANIGGVKIELIQPIGAGPWREFLETKGGGMHHLAYAVEDVPKEEAKLVKKGIKAIYNVKFREGGAAAYFDTSKLGGLFDVIELVRWPPE